MEPITKKRSYYREKGLVQTSVWLELKELHFLREAASSKSISMIELIREIIRKYLNDNLQEWKQDYSLQNKQPNT